MKKTITTALVLALLASTSAYAQSGQDRRGEGRQNRGEEARSAEAPPPPRENRRGDRSGNRGQRQAPPQAQPQPQPTPQAQPQTDRRGERQRPDRPAYNADRGQPQWQGQSGRSRGPGGQADRRDERRPDATPDRSGSWASDRGRDGRPDASPGQNNRSGQGSWDRNGDGRPDARQGQGNRSGQSNWDRNGDGRPDARQGQGNRSGQGNWDRDDRRGDHRWDGRRPGEGRQLRSRDNNRRWYDQRSWRQSYHSQHRYRVAPYRYPRGWYANSWSYNDFLPFGWFTSSYYLNWGAYGLPYPPIGCEWVRVGQDALLVDIWSGRVVSVYYGLFW